MNAKTNPEFKITNGPGKFDLANALLRGRKYDHVDFKVSNPPKIEDTVVPADFREFLLESSVQRVTHQGGPKFHLEGDALFPDKIAQFFSLTPGWHGYELDFDTMTRQGKMMVYVTGSWIARSKIS